MRVIALILFALAFSILGIVYFRPEYRSAFEADQQCHFELSTYDAGIKAVACDHDTETRQWILYQSTGSDMPAEVIKRFKY